MAKLEVLYNGKLIRELTPSEHLNEETAANIYANAEGSFYLLQKFIAAISRDILEMNGGDVSKLPEYDLVEILSEAAAFSDLIDKQTDADEYSEV